MALGFSVVKSWPRVTTGGVVQKIVDVTWDNAYPAGGEAVTAADFGLRGIIDIKTHAISTNGYVIDWDKANSKLRAFQVDADGVADVPLEDNSSVAALNAIVTRVLVFGW